MKVTLGTTAGDFATLAPEQVKGTRREGFGALKMAQEAAECGVGSPQTLAALGEFGAQTVLHICVHNTDCQAKFSRTARNRLKTSPRSTSAKKPPAAGFPYPLFPTV
jgi:hypothetical protein